MKVKLVKYNAKTRGEELVAVLSLKDGVVVCEPEEWIKVMEPIRNYKENKIREWLTPKDGKKFLENMPFSFRSPYGMAILEVKDDA
jgi:hypothetical protein